MIGRYPMTAPPLDSVRIDSGNSFWVGVSEAKLSINKTAPIEQAGRLDVTTVVKTEDAIDGFEGGGFFTFMDQAGNVVYKLMGNAHGVNGTAIPGKSSSDTNHDTFP